MAGETEGYRRGVAADSRQAGGGPKGHKLPPLYRMPLRIVTQTQTKLTLLESHYQEDVVSRYKVVA